MMKFNLSSITIILLYFITVMASRLKEDTVDGDNYAQNTSESQDQNSNLLWDAEMKIQNKTSKHIGVTWRTDCKKWRADLKHNGKKHYGGYFDIEEHAAMKVNLLCDEYGIERKNLTIDIKATAMKKVQNKTSLYTGVSWNTDCKKWQTNFSYKGRQYYGGLFDNEERAAMKINLLCDENGIKRKNLTIDIGSDVIQKIQNKTTNYYGVCWNTNHKKWQTWLVHNKKKYYGGYFDNEEHAAMKINLLCDEHRIQRKNLTIDIEPAVISQKIQNKTSIYTGVSWNSDKKKWQTNLRHNAKQYYGGLFDNEEHAAMKINLLCDEYGIKRKNLMIDIELHATAPKKKKSKIDQSKKENMIKTQEESILYGFKDECEKNFMNSDYKEINNDTAAASCYKIQKRKRALQLDYK